MAGSVSLELKDIACVRGGRLLFERLSLRLSAGQWLQVAGCSQTAGWSKWRQSVGNYIGSASVCTSGSCVGRRLKGMLRL